MSVDVGKVVLEIAKLGLEKSKDMGEVVFNKVATQGGQSYLSQFNGTKKNKKELVVDDSSVPPKDNLTPDIDNGEVVVQDSSILPKNNLTPDILINHVLNDRTQFNVRLKLNITNWTSFVRKKKILHNLLV